MRRFAIVAPDGVIVLIGEIEDDAFAALEPPQGAILVDCPDEVTSPEGWRWDGTQFQPHMRSVLYAHVLPDGSIFQLGQVKSREEFEALPAIGDALPVERPLAVDDPARWVWTGETFTPVPPPPPTWGKIRRERDGRLAACDWTQMPDVPLATAAAWQPYRQTLRDITETFASPGDVIWPEPPTYGASARRVTPLQFFDLFTAPEQAAIFMSADPSVRALVTRASAATFVDLDNTEVADGIAYLESIGLIEPGRGDVILGSAIP